MYTVCSVPQGSGVFLLKGSFLTPPPLHLTPIQKELQLEPSGSSEGGFMSLNVGPRPALIEFRSLARDPLQLNLKP